MKSLFCGFLVLLATNAYAVVDPIQCPNEIVVSLAQVEKVELNSTIENDFFLKTIWSNLFPCEELHRTFRISSRTKSALCVYVGDGKAAYLQTNNFQDELVIPYYYNTYFRVKITEFSPKHLRFQAAGSTDLMAPIVEISDGGSVAVDEAQVGKAQGIIINVKP